MCDESKGVVPESAYDSDSNDPAIYRGKTALQMLAAEIRALERTQSELEDSIADLKKKRTDMKGEIIWFERTAYGMEPATWVKSLMFIFGWSTTLGLLSGLLLMFTSHWGIATALIVYGILSFVVYAYLCFRTSPRT